MRGPIVLAGIVLAMLVCLAATGIASGQVADEIRKGAPAPYDGVILDDATAIRAAAAVEMLKEIRARLEHTEAKLVESREQVSDLHKRVGVIEAILANQSEQLAAIQKIVEGQAKNEIEMAKALDRTEKTLAAISKAVDRIGHKRWWEYGLDLLKLVGLGFLVLSILQ